MKAYFILVVALSFTLSFSQTTVEDLANAQVFTIPEILYENSNITLTAEAGKVFVVKIKGNPTTGYQIYLRNKVSELSQSGLVTPLGLTKDNTTDYITDPHPDGYVGVGGYYFFKFQAVKAGDVQLIFENKRSWEKDPSLMTTLTVNIRIVQP